LAPTSVRVIRLVERWSKRTRSSSSSDAIIRETDDGSVPRPLATTAKLPRRAT
jgi:hypothetical protein